MIKRTGLLGPAVLLLVVGAGCGLNMERNYQKLRPKLLDRDYGDAVKYVDKTKTTFYDKDNRLLYYMDKAMVLHLAGRYKESNAVLEQAKSTAEDLWTESVGKNALAWVTTDNSLPYQGEDFEKVMLHVVAALNYVALGEDEAARVEARQVTAKLELYNSKYEDAHKSVYRDDAFARWLSGKLRATDEDTTALNDAWIDYRKAIDLYAKEYAKRYATPLPRFVVEDAMRALAALGPDFAEEYRELRNSYPSLDVGDAAASQELGEVVLIHLSGEAPYKRDLFWTAQSPAGILRIAYPQFVAKPHLIQRVRLTAGGVQAVSEVAEDLTGIAIQNLADHMGRIKAKAIARAVSKFVAAKGMQAGGKAVGKKSQGAGAALQVAGALFEVSNAIAEEADKRSWITLPAKINVARLMIPPGPFTIQADFLGPRGEVVERTELRGEASAGKTTFLSYRTYR